MLELATWNVNSLRARLPLVLRYLDAHPVDVLCLQETRVADASFPRQPFAERGYHVATSGSSSYAGVALITREPLDDVITGISGYDEPRSPGRRLAGRLGSVWIDTVYVPTRTAIGKVEFLEALRADHLVRFTASSSLVLAGDFNVCFDQRDFASPTMISDVERHTQRPEDLAWRRLLDLGLHDCFRLHTEEPGHYTWFPTAPWAFRRNYGMRLDYVFATAPVSSTTVDVKHDRETRTWERPSDHVPVRARFAL